MSLSLLFSSSIIMGWFLIQFFWYQLLWTTSEDQQLARIRRLKYLIFKTLLGLRNSKKVKDIKIYWCRINPLVHAFIMLEDCLELPPPWSPPTVTALMTRGRLRKPSEPEHLPNQIGCPNLWLMSPLKPLKKTTFTQASLFKKGRPWYVVALVTSTVPSGWFEIDDYSW